jgi:hypothetical protein
MVARGELAMPGTRILADAPLSPITFVAGAFARWDRRDRRDRGTHVEINWCRAKRSNHDHKNTRTMSIKTLA